MSAPRFSDDGKSITVPGDRRSHRSIPSRVTLGRRSASEQLMKPPIVVSSRHMRRRHAPWCSRGGDDQPNEIYRRGAAATLRQLTHQNDALFAELQLGDDRRGELQEQGRHRGPRPADQAGRLCRRDEGPAAAAHPRRSERPGSALVQLRAAVVRRQRLRGAGGELSRQRGPRRRSSRAPSAADWGHYEVEDLQAGVDQVDQDGRRRSGPARRRRLELRRHPHRLHDRQRHALQGRHQRRRHGVHGRLLRHRSVHHPVRLRDRSAVESEGVGDVP